jgi:pSer/pThr/pTyr-binding forkhead associated (FHA) protein
MEGNMLDFVLRISHYTLPVLALAILILCFSALFRRRVPSLGKTKLINTVNGDSFPIVSRETSIGRHKNCDIILNYPTVSRMHAVIICAKDGWYISAIRSGSEVLVNGKKITKKEFLKTGDKITIANINLIFDNKQGK